MKARLIGVKSCRHCRHLVKSWGQQGVKFVKRNEEYKGNMDGVKLISEYWDGDDDNLQDELDKMNIDDFPVIQIIDNSGAEIFTFDHALYPTGVSFKKIWDKIQTLETTI